MVLSFGTHESGTAYLVTERISGIKFDIVGD
jgi:hypothetical protein